MAACFAATPAAAQNGAGKDEAYALHVQSTFTLQSVLPFPARYSGPNSLPSHGQTRETFDLTLYAGVRPWAGAELWADGEIDQGFGVGNTLGAAAFPSGEAYKVGKAEPYARLQRLFLRQTIGLGGEDERVAADANQLGGHRRADRLVLTAGKLSVVDIFDTNAYAHDPRGDFLNWALVDAAAFDYAAEAWGYTLGGAAELWKGRWTARAGLFNLSKVPNGETPGRDFSQYQAVGEVEHRHAFAGHDGAIRVGLWLNRGRFSSFADALARAAASGTAPDPSLTRRMRSRAGAYLNVEQEATATLGLFLRAGLADGAVEPYDFTDVDRSLALGGSLKGRGWGRGGDRIGFGLALDGISAIHRRYLAAGGLGILVGDGRLDRSGTEQATTSSSATPPTIVTGGRRTCSASGPTQLSSSSPRNGSRLVGAPEDVDGRFDGGEEAADREGGERAVLDRALEHLAPPGAGDDDHHRARLGERGGGEGDEVAFGRLDADRAAAARRVEDALEIGAGDEAGGAARLVHAEADEVERPAQQGQAGVGQARGFDGVVERAFIDQREHLGALGGEPAFEHAVAAFLAGERDQPVGGREQRDLAPVEALGFGERGEDRVEPGLPRQRQPRAAMRLDRALDHESDIAGGLLSQLRRALEFPPFQLVHLGSFICGTPPLVRGFVSPVAGALEELSHACQIESAAEGRRGRPFGQARRHAQEQAQGRVQVDGRFDEREGAREDGLDQAQGEAGARRELKAPSVAPVEAGISPGDEHAAFHPQDRGLRRDDGLGQSPPEPYRRARGDR
jgi:high affinity Mn2+ porin